MREQVDIYDMLGNKPQGVELESMVQQDDITREISRIFDYEFQGEVTEVIDIPSFPSDFDIGLIVGSSGSGKSTILKRAFGEEELITWEDGKSIASHFNSFEEASNKFGAVGLNSIPTWLKPYKVLSNGEAFRADLARRLHDGAVIVRHYVKGRKMKIKVGKFYLCSDRYCYWINEEYEVEKGKTKGAKKIRNVTGYCHTFEKVIQTFRERRIGNTEATTFIQLLDALKDIFEDMIELDRAKFESDTDKLKEMIE